MENIKASDFLLKDQFGNQQSLSKYKGEWVFLFFYPKDNTPACIIETSSIMDNMAYFKIMGINVIGMNIDDESSHARFSSAQEINFPLLSDKNGEIAKKFGAWGEAVYPDGKFTGVLRKSFLINPLGEIEKQYEEVNPQTHGSEVIKDASILIKKFDVKHYWFKAKRFGYGWYPIGIKGWGSIILYVVSLTAFSMLMSFNSFPLKTIFISFVLLFLVETSGLIYLCVKKGEKAKWNFSLKNYFSKIEKNKKINF